MSTLNGIRSKKLRPGDTVVVRPAHQIAATLDPSGALDGLPFLVEMAKYCGHSFKVRRRVNKLIQEGVGSSMRRIKDVVLLEGTICDGHAHGDCQRACFPLWKTAWLEPVAETHPDARDMKGMAGEASPASGPISFPSGRGCQVTELLRATKPLPLWHPLRHYWDLSARTYTSHEYLAYVIGGLYRRTLKKIVHRFLKRTPVPSDLAPEPPLDLKPGDLVEVKSFPEIKATLNAVGKYRGLYFMPGMKAFCGQQLRVLQSIERMMSERTGEMRALGQTVVLEGVTCDGKAHGGCQRGCYVFWKDAWLRRADRG